MAYSVLTGTHLGVQLENGKLSWNMPCDLQAGCLIYAPRPQEQVLNYKSRLENCGAPKKVIQRDYKRKMRNDKGSICSGPKHKTMINSNLSFLMLPTLSNCGNSFILQSKTQESVSVRPSHSLACIWKRIC